MNPLLTTGFLILLSVAVAQSQWFSRQVEDEVENELDACEVEYKKVGCFREKISHRALSDLIFNDRKNIQWESDKWEKYMKRLACRCAIESDYKGYTHFGLQFYGECWSGPHAAEVFPTYGESKKCVGAGYEPCDDQSSSECVGDAGMNYIYRIVGPDLGGSGFGEELSVE